MPKNKGRFKPISLPMSPFAAFKERWRDCTACYLHETRKQVVLSRGTYPCDVVFCAEAPGASEDAIGIPMCGPAGHLMDHIINQSVPKGVTYSICNLVCCIPRGEDGRKIQEPEDECVKACSPRLIEYMEICDPKVIICVGKLAYDWLDTRYRNSIKLHRDIPKVSMRHPAAILRMSVAMQGLEVQKCMIAVRNACEDYVLEG